MRGGASIAHAAWLAAADTPRPPLATDARAEVCVIGGGIAGLSIAYHLVREGRSVVVLDYDPLGDDQQGPTTAHLSNALGGRYTRIVRTLGVSGARLYADSHTAAIDRIESIVATEAIECDFERLDGYLIGAREDAPAVLDEEAEASRIAGLTDVAVVARAPLAALGSGPAVCYPRQAQLDARRYLSGLTRAIERRGGRVHGGTRVDTASGGRPARVRARGGIVMCDAIVLAGATPLVGRELVDARRHARTTCEIAAGLARGAAAHALCWDTAAPCQYVRVQRAAEGDVLVVGSVHDTAVRAGDPARVWAKLESWMRERFEGVGEATYRRCDESFALVDGLGLIGANPDDHENVFIATAAGIVDGTISGMLLGDLVHRRDNAWAPLFDPARLRRHQAQSVDTTLQAGACSVSGADLDVSGSILPGEGAVVRRDVSKVAVYRDEHGALHERSAMCPHLGCTVGWNRAEGTWDCPCHGSRFDPYGGLLKGPAAADLPAADPPHPRAI